MSFWIRFERYRILITNCVAFTFVVIIVCLVIGCSGDSKTIESTPTPTQITPTQTTQTLDQSTEYVLHVMTVWENCNTKIGWSGDYSGSQFTPFDIGPMTDPFTVDISMVDHGCKLNSNRRYDFSMWVLNGERIDTTDGTITVKVGDDNPDCTLGIEHYLKYTKPP